MAKKKINNKMVRVTQTKSTIGALANHKACLRGLGIRRMHHTVDVIDTPENRGMINKAIHLLTVVETK